MTKLQQLGLNRIKELADGMDIERCRRVSFKDTPPNDDELRAKDEASAERWSRNDAARREIIEWAGALMVYPDA